jgi:Protein of unknown function (DUF3105)
VTRSRRALIALAVAAVAVVACGTLILLLAARDSSGVVAPRGPGALQPDHGHRQLPASAPSRPASPPADPPTSGSFHHSALARDGVRLSDDQLLTALANGNVVLAYDAARPPAALRRLQRQTAGAYDAFLEGAGQAVILARRPGVSGVVALAWRRLLRVADPTDPRLGDFIDAWLGQGPLS